MRYRKEIDGLRAVAVVPVILFHAGLESFGGGFVGVDVFFVISGYLITHLLLSEIDSGDFSIARFYARRIRRILPMLYLVMAMSAAAGWHLMLPYQFENLGQSLVATTLFANNILLAMTTGYWDILITLKPLAHTWSLAVEEQFYAIFPLALLLWRRVRRHPAGLVIALAVASLIAALWEQRHSTIGSFYLSQGRFWEILAGSLCALCERRYSPRENDIAAGVGLALIVGAVLAYDARMPFPSAYTLVPVIGTALIMMFGTGESRIGRLLSLPPLVGIGLVSYSAYLWHQPLFAFVRLYSKSDPAPAFLAALVPGILFLSYLSWRFVEMPFRDRERIGTRLLCILAGTFSLAFILLGLFLHRAHGVPARIYPAALAGAGGMDSGYNMSAFRYKRDAFVTDKPVRLLVIGNSFGRDIVNIVRETRGEADIEIVYRDDLDHCPERHRGDSRLGRLVERSSVIFIIGMNRRDLLCLGRSLAWARSSGKRLLYFGTKNFGTNINWIMREPRQRRALLTNAVPASVARLDHWIERTVSADHYVSLMRSIMIDGKVPFTDEKGRLLSGDTRHLTRYGAIYVGARLMRDPRLREAFGVDGARGKKETPGN